MLDGAEVRRFADLVSGHFGLAFDPAKQDQLGRVLQDRLEGTGCPGPEAYFELLRSAGPASREFRLLAERLTVAETYFFRHPDQFRAFADLAASWERPAGRRRVLSAGCSSGEEPYTLAMLVKEQGEEGLDGGADILGININAALLAKARQGRYSEWALRGTPEAFRRRYFRPEGREFLLDEGIRAMVTFEERNLMAEDPAFWRPGSFDVIFCRNVIMYFTPGAMEEVVDRFARALAPGGFLFLGPAETLRGLSHAFDLVHTHETFYYRRRADGAPEARSAPREQIPALPSAPPSPPWPEAIAQASARIRALSEGARPAEALPPAGGAGPDLGQAMELLRRERFHEAGELLGAQPAEGDADSQLLRAVVLAQKGDFGEAERVCARVLALDGLNAGAHYLTALCREEAGDSAGAAAHDEAAAYLDPTFAMPHLHLGLLARRQGRAEAARRELELAHALLLREDMSRILLFGGGFSREALAQLCRASGGGS